MTGRDAKPLAYGEIVRVLMLLPVLIEEKRRRDGLSLREAARQMGMSFSTVARMERGEDLVLSNAIKVLRWIDGAS